jgi:hypothetical protein
LSNSGENLAVFASCARMVCYYLLAYVPHMVQASMKQAAECENVQDGMMTKDEGKALSCYYGTVSEGKA